MRDTFIKRLSELATENRDIVLLTGDLGFGVLTDFAKNYPEQFINVGVAEQNLTGVATGLALSGKVTFTYSIANFPTLRCLEQIRNDACYHDANVKIVAIGGGFSYGSLGMSHHATEDLAILRSFPMTVVSPGELWEVEQLTDALFATPGCCYLRLDKSDAGYIKGDAAAFAIGKAREMHAGDDITLITTGGILGEVMQTAEILKAQNINARVLNMHSIKPFDHESVIQAAKQTGGIITIEEHTIDGGLGSIVAETCMEAGVYPKAFHRLALRAGFSSIVGSQQYLRNYYQLDRAAIIKAVNQLLGTQLTAEKKDEATV